jgi:3-oxoacyl-(acyl-carrier-protein) synthase
LNPVCDFEISNLKFDNFKLPNTPHESEEPEKQKKEKEAGHVESKMYNNSSGFGGTNASLLIRRHEA